MTLRTVALSLLMVAVVAVVWIGGLPLAVPCFCSFVIGLIMARGRRDDLLSTRDLAILREIDAHGSAGVRGLEIAEKVGRPWWVSIYPELQDLEDAGFLTSTITANGIRYRLYRLSWTGRTLVDAMNGLRRS